MEVTRGIGDFLFLNQNDYSRIQLTSKCFWGDYNILCLSRLLLKRLSYRYMALICSFMILQIRWRYSQLVSSKERPIPASSKPQSAPLPMRISQPFGCEESVVVSIGQDRRVWPYETRKSVAMNCCRPI